MEEQKRRSDRHPRKKNKRTEEQTAEDLKFCAGLYLKGYSYQRIADKLNEWNAGKGKEYKIDRGQIYYDMKKLQNQWLSEAKDLIHTHQIKELAKLDNLEAEAWESYEKSKFVKSKKVKYRPKEGKEYTDLEKMEKVIDYEEIKDEETPGNPKFLDVILRCIDKRCTLLGLNAPIQIALPTKEEQEARGDALVITEEVKAELIKVAGKMQGLEA